MLLLSSGAQALRCLALAYKPVPQASSSSLSPLDEAGLTFIALVAMHDPPRRECAAAIQMCRQVGCVVGRPTCGGLAEHQATTL